jgi:hypothetical protein
MRLLLPVTAVLRCADLLSAARLLDTVVQSGLKHSASNEHYQVTKAVLTTLQSVPAVQQIPVEIYIGMLQGSTSMAFLLTALLQLPQAQLVTPSMTVTLLTRTAKHDRPLLLEGLLRCVDWTSASHWVQLETSLRLAASWQWP